MVKAYLFILFLQALYLVPGSKLVEYRFGVNFGQVFYDYSENSLYGINGVSSTTLTSDTLATDRGAYFAEGTEVVTFPPNDKSSINFLLPSQYSIISGQISSHLLATQIICTTVKLPMAIVFT